MKKVHIDLPEYFTVNHYRMFDGFATMGDQEAVIEMVASLTEHTIEEIKEWPVQLIVKVHNELNRMLANMEPEFYPVIEWKGKMYGYQPMHKMTTGEYIDVDNLSKDTLGNLNELLAVLYRPITRNKLSSWKWLTKAHFKAIGGNVENAFKYYDVEKYNTDSRKEQAKEMDEFPAQVALGAMTFFLSTKLQLSKDTQTSSLNWDKMQVMMKEETKSKIKLALRNTMAGYILSTTLAKPRSYPLQVIRQ